MPEKIRFTSYFRRLIMVTVFAASAGSFLWAQNMDFLYWRHKGQKRVEDGGVVADFELCGLPAVEDGGAVDVYYTALPFKAPGSGKFEPTPPELFQKTGGLREGKMRIYSGRYEAVEIWARTARDGRVFTAQTRMSLFGEAPLVKPDAEDWKRIDALPPLYRVAVFRSRDVANPDAESLEQEGLDSAHAYTYSIMQTGEEALIRLLPPPSAAAPPPEAENTPPPPAKPLAARVYEAGVFAGNAEGGAYIFPDYPELADAGMFAWKDVTFAFELPDAVVSYTIPVYRAIYGKTNLPAGLALLAAVLLAGTSAVLVYGRRRAAPASRATPASRASLAKPARRTSP